MKNLAILILLTMFLAIGCDDNSSILEPSDDYAQESLSKGRPILLGDTDNKLLGDGIDDIILEDEGDEDNYFVINKGRPILSLDTDKLILADDNEDPIGLDNYNVKYSKNFTIDGEKGGHVSVKHRWIDSNGKQVWLETELWIPKGAFEGTMTFDMIFDLENYAMELYPSPFTFNKPVELYMFWYGLDLSDYLGYNFDFNYLDASGEEIKYDYSHIDIGNGNLVIEGAQLHHFSRYGWTRTK